MRETNLASGVSAPVPLLGKRAGLFSESTGVWDRLLSLDRLRDLYIRASQGNQERSFHQNLLQELGVSYAVGETDLRRIPAAGPVVMVANHPFGMLEGSLLGVVLPKARRDYKVMTNQLLACMPELATHCVFVDAFGSKASARENSRALKQAIAWLREGHVLVIFPAGEVSHWNFRHAEVEDPQWNETVSRLIRLTKAPAVPLFFKGTNSIPFHLLGMVHPRLRTARLPQELLNKRGRQVTIRIGSPIPYEVIEKISDHTDATRYLRWRTYLLAHRGETAASKPIRFRSKPPLPQQLLADETPRNLLLADLAGLPPEQCLEDSRDFSVHLADAGQIPSLLRELGRLREMTFRLVGEGTGHTTDIDRFDSYYQHLLLWNKQNGELAGAYRIGHAPSILSSRGVSGLYTSTLFHYDPSFFGEIGPALELGRSFVRPEYQKSYAPLLMLWKGLGRYISRNPGTPVLFGAVSVSNDYHPVSRRLVARFLEEELADKQLGRMVRARRPLRSSHRATDGAAVLGFLPDLDVLSKIIGDVEPDGEGIPILLKQYLKLGGKLLGFNVDSQFSEALDGLILVDLRKTQREILERYMGKDGAADFLSHASAESKGRPSNQEQEQSS